MKILHIETSSKNCSVAISENEELLCLCEEVSHDYKQSENLHVFVQWALEGAQIELKEIECISLGMGPGSYTGLRIGSASAKGFCFGLNVPMVAINSLETMVEKFIFQGYEFIIPMIDARRKEVYTSIFNGETGEMVGKTEAKVLDEFSFQEFNEKKILFIGDGAEKAQEILNLNRAQFISDVYPSSQGLIKKAMQKITKKEFEDIAYFEPFYLKDFYTAK